MSVVCVVRAVPVSVRVSQGPPLSVCQCALVVPVPVVRVVRVVQLVVQGLPVVQVVQVVQVVHSLKKGGE